MKAIRKTSLFLFAIINANASFAVSYIPDQEDTTIIVPDGKWVKRERLQPYHQLVISYNITNGQEVITGSVNDTYQFIKINKKEIWSAGG